MSEATQVPNAIDTAPRPAPVRERKEEAPPAEHPLVSDTLETPPPASSRSTLNLRDLQHRAEAAALEGRDGGALAPPAVFARTDRSSAVVPPASAAGEAAPDAAEARAAEMLRRLSEDGEAARAPAYRVVGGPSPDRLRDTVAARHPLGERIAGVLQLPSEGRAAYGRLAERDRLDVDRLLGAIGTDPSPSGRLARMALANLLDRGTLRARDASGATILETLAARAGQPLAAPLGAAGLEPGAPVRDILTALAYPGFIFQGEDTATCVAAEPFKRDMTTVIVPASFVAAAASARAAGGNGAGEWLSPMLASLAWLLLRRPEDAYQLALAAGAAS